MNPAGVFLGFSFEGEGAVAALGKQLLLRERLQT